MQLDQSEDYTSKGSLLMPATISGPACESSDAFSASRLAWASVASFTAQANIEISGKSTSSQQDCCMAYVPGSETKA